MEFIPSDIQKYSEDHTSRPGTLLDHIDRQTHLEVLKPRMLSGHLQGRWLSMISHMMQPARILEVGTYTGYAAICLAEGLQPKGKLITLEVNEELIPRIQRTFDQSPFKDKLKVIHGNASEIIPALKEVWDLVFIDADKERYAVYYDMILPKVRPGGVLIIDNVLWSGKVADKNHQDKKTSAIRTFNQMIQDDERVENLLLPFRDGLMMVRKKEVQ